MDIAFKSMTMSGLYSDSQTSGGTCDPGMSEITSVESLDPVGFHSPCTRQCMEGKAEPTSLIVRGALN